MGQTQARASKRAESVSSYHEKQTYDHPMESDGIGCCTGVYQSLASGKIMNNKWKKKTLDELQGLSLEIWPQQMIVYLKKYKQTEYDKNCQNDALWLDQDASHLEREASNNFLEIGKAVANGKCIVQTRNEFNIESINEIPNTKEISHDSHENSLELDLAIKTLLFSSELLEENLSHLSHKENWMERSFDIQIPQENQLLTSYFDMIQEDNGKNPSKPKRQTSKKIEEAYNNNTILNQFSPTNMTGNQFGTESYDLYQSVLKYKNMTNLIEGHLKHSSNIFCQLISIFESYFVNTYSKILEIPDQEDIVSNEVNDFAVKAILDLQQFIRILYEAVNSFYSLKLLSAGRLPDGETLFNRDNMINFVTSIVFNQRIYDLVFKLCQKQDNQIEGAYQKNIQLCKKLKPEDFGIPDAYCLNEKTFNYFREKRILNQNCFMKELEEHSGNTKENGKEILTEIDSGKSESEEPSKEDLSVFLSENKIPRELLTHPYEKAIETLKTLQDRRSPVHKLKTILKVIELISTAIEEFYQKFGVVNSKKLDADQTLSICLYIVARSGLSNITTHCRLIERFSTTNILHSVSGYYATTLEACVNCLCAMDLPQNASNDEISVTIRKHKQSLDMTS